MKNPFAKILRVAAVTLALIVPAAVTIPATTANAAPAPAAQQKTHAKEIAELFELHNTERAKAGLAPLIFAATPSLTISQPWNDVLADRDNATLNHQSIAAMRWAGTSPVGENLIIGITPTSSSPYAGTPAKLVTRWMNSAGHRANILNKNYKYIGIGWSVAKSGDIYATTNFYGGTPTTAGKLYTTGAQIITGLSGTQVTGAAIYTTPGYHFSSGREWHTRCEPYSTQIDRCWTSIKTGGQWVHNNLTYTPAPRALWAGNPLGGYGQYGYSGQWTSSGRQWRVECDTAATGRGACRAYMKSGSAWVFNNIVLFTN